MNRHGIHIENKMNMKTILIHSQEPELSTAWAGYLSSDGSAVFTSSDAMESAEILSMVKVDTLIIAGNSPDPFLLLGKTLSRKKNYTNIIAVTEIPPSRLQLLLATDSFVTMALPFTFSKLKGAVEAPQNILEAASNAFVLQSR